MQVDLSRIRREKPLRELLQFGIINLDKPSGPTSFAATQMVRRAVGARKAGHFGTLDPKVTGVLPVALDRARRLAQWFIQKDKLYVGVMRLHAEVPREQLQELMDGFVGAIEQLPPAKSRVKRQVRQRRVYGWKILETDGRDVRFEAWVEGGTYVSKLIHDLGQGIGGAHMIELRRTRAGIFSESDPSFTSLERLRDAVARWQEGCEEPLRELIVPGEVIGLVLPVVQVREEGLEPLRAGGPLTRDKVRSGCTVPAEGDVAVFCAGRFVEVARIVRQGDVIARPRFVYG